MLALPLMLDHLGEPAAGDLIRSAVSQELDSGTVRLSKSGQPLAGTRQAAEAFAAAVAAVA